MRGADAGETIVALGSRRGLAAGVARFQTEMWGCDLGLGWQVGGSWQVAHRWLSPRRRDTLSPGRRGEPAPFAVLDRAAAAIPAGIRVRRCPDPALMAAIIGRTDDGTRLGPVRD